MSLCCVCNWIDHSSPPPLFICLHVYSVTQMAAHPLFRRSNAGPPYLYEAKTACPRATAVRLIYDSGDFVWISVSETRRSSTLGWRYDCD